MLTTSPAALATDANATEPPVFAWRLVYAALDWWTFPAPPDGSKKSLKSKKKTGVNWGATIDPDVIRKEFRQHRYRDQNVGLRTGVESGLFVVECDTAAGHGEGVDGGAALRAWEAEHGELPVTLMAMSPSGSVHRYFKHPGAGIKVKSSNAIFGPGSGVDCKGDLGMVIAPPSTRPDRPGKPGGVYVWINWGTPIAAAPAALLDVVVEKPPVLATAETPPSAPRKAAGNTFNDPSNFAPRRGDGVTHWQTVNEMALANLSAWFPALFPGGATPYQAGYRVTSKWLDRSLQEDISALPEGIQDFGEERGFTPIDLVIEHRSLDRYEAKSWLCEQLGIEDETGISFNVDEIVEPTAPPATFLALEIAREALADLVNLFIDRHFSERGRKAELYLQIARECGIDCPSDVWALRTATGLGKTMQMIRAIAGCDDIKRGIFAVPNHFLSAEIEHRFRQLGVLVKIFRGRMQPDPESPSDLMCRKPEEVELARDAKLPISETCCSSKNHKCEFYDTCGYQRQKDVKAKVIVVASDMLFHDEKSLGNPDIIVIDEAVWKKSLRGVELDREGFFIPFEKLRYLLTTMSASLQVSRQILAYELQQQEDDGGLERRFVTDSNGDGMQDDKLRRMIVEEWMWIDQLTKKIGIHPGLTLQEMEGRRKKHHKLIQQIVLARNIITLLEELREMLRRPEIEVSGRILLEENDGIRGIRWRGVAPIVERYRAPTVVADATLPDEDVLKVMFPNVEIVGDISVDFPECVRVRQYLGSPTSANKLIHTADKKNPERHLAGLRRHILRRWIETGRQPTLVICQKKVEHWLKDKLPKKIAIAHFNAISGLDIFKNVRLLIIAGRTIPNPIAVEAIAATLSGAMPVSAEADAKGFYWYDRAKRAIRLRDGTGRSTYGDQHPDELCESVRKLVCEAELVQAIRRGRGINRDASTPLDFDLLFNECLPGAVDEVLLWDDPSALIETALEGVMLTSPVDLMKVWPAIWPNLRRAERTLKLGIPALPGFTVVKYRLAGPKMKTRTGYFDLSLIPEPLQWLEERLGPMAPKE